MSGENVNVHKDSVSDHVPLSERIFYYVYMAFLFFLFSMMLIFGLGYAKYLIKQRKIDKWLNTAGNILPMKAGNEVEYREFDRDIDHKYVRLLPEFTLETLKPDELEQLKP